MASFVCDCDRDALFIRSQSTQRETNRFVSLYEYLKAGKHFPAFITLVNIGSAVVF